MNALQYINLFSGLIFVLVAILVALRRRADWYSRPFLFLILINIFGVVAVLIETSEYYSLWWLGYHFLYVHIAFVPAAWYMTTARWGIDISEYSQRRRFFTWTGLLISLILYLLLYASQAIDLTLYGIRWAVELHGWSFIVGAYFIIATTLGLYALETCYRSSLGLVRERIRRVFFPLIAYGISLLAVATTTVLYHTISDWIATGTFLLLAMICIPAGRHYIHFAPKSDGIILTRKGIYSSISVVLVGIYLLIIGSTGQLLIRYDLDDGIFFSIVVLIIMVMTFMILFGSQAARSPLRKVSGQRQMPQSHGDFAEEWKEFSEEISVILDMDAIFDRASHLLRRLMRIEHSCFVILEKSPDGNYALYSGNGISRGISGRRLAKLADWLYRIGHPAEASTLREKAPDETAELEFVEKQIDFPIEMVVPLVARRQFLGFWGIGRHAGDRSLSSAEIGFIEAAANPLALTILGARITQELVESREIESFYKIASYVLHDLKNSVGMLSMLLQNAEKNIQNPEFQREALITIGKAVDRQKKIISRLTQQTTDDTLSTGPVSLSRMLRHTLDRLKIESVKTIELSLDIDDTLSVMVDEDKIGSVFDNLIMNAIEAMPDGGKLHISSFETDLDSMIAVRFSDTGSGMDEEFIATRLFKPFSSTKSHGLGIGMFQSRDIIYAHRGRIEVTSRIGEGTEFTVYLPGERTRE